MASLSPTSPSPLPTDLAALPELLAYSQSLGLERHLHRRKRDISTLAVCLLWLCLVWGRARSRRRPRRRDMRKKVRTLADWQADSCRGSAEEPADTAFPVRSMPSTACP